MKTLPKIFIASLLMTVLMLPISAVSDQLPAPLQKNLLPGTTVIEYAGQTLRFTTDVPLQVSFLALDQSRIRLEFRVRGTQSLPPGSAPSSTNVQIFWEDWSNTIYDDPAPPDGWTGILLTESGFTEK